MNSGSFKNLLKKMCLYAIKSKGGARGVMVIVVGTATRVQILDQANCISHSTNTLGKGMNQIILPPARLSSSVLKEATSLGEGKL